MFPTVYRHYLPTVYRLSPTELKCSPRYIVGCAEFTLWGNDLYTVGANYIPWVQIIYRSGAHWVQGPIYRGLCTVGVYRGEQNIYRGCIPWVTFCRNIYRGEYILWVHVPHGIYILAHGILYTLGDILWGPSDILWGTLGFVMYHDP